MQSNGPGRWSGMALRQLVADAQDDAAAFGALYDRYVDRVHAFAYRMLGSRSDAEDVTSETFLRALVGLERFAWRGGGFEGWLLSIARNLCLDHLRRRARVVVTSEIGEAGPPNDEPSAPGPEEAALQAEQAQRLRNLVAELPEAQREIVLLRFAAGLTTQGAAAATSRSATAASSLLNRAITRLRERLGANAP